MKLNVEDYKSNWHAIWMLFRIITQVNRRLNDTEIYRSVTKSKLSPLIIEDSQPQLSKLPGNICTSKFSTKFKNKQLLSRNTIINSTNRKWIIVSFYMKAMFLPLSLDCNLNSLNSLYSNSEEQSCRNQSDSRVSSAASSAIKL